MFVRSLPRLSNCSYIERALEYLINLKTKTPYVGDERKLLHELKKKLHKIEVIIKFLYKIIKIFNELFPFDFMHSPS